MIRNRRLSRSIADASWGKLETMLAYKCEWYGNNLFYAPRFAPTSKRCFDCGAITKNSNYPTGTGLVQAAASVMTGTKMPLKIFNTKG